MSSPLRRAIERRSTPVLLALRRMPGWVPFLVLLALVLGGLFAPAPLGAALLVLVALLVGWLVYLAWPVLPASGRVIRAALVVLILIAAVRRVVSG